MYVSLKKKLPTEFILLPIVEFKKKFSCFSNYTKKNTDLLTQLNNFIL